MPQTLKSHLGSSVQAMRQFLDRQVTLKNGHVTLGPSTRTLEAQTKAAEDRRARGCRMDRELYRLLEQHPATRQLMRHLDLVERSLRVDGLDGVEALPVRIISLALAELERLVWDWSQVDLAELRSRMAVMSKTRSGELARDSVTTETLVHD
ncbi:MAG: hypothetical protein ABIQ60_09895, partial [Burkholderiaceae bacterium]